MATGVFDGATPAHRGAAREGGVHVARFAPCIGLIATVALATALAGCDIRNNQTGPAAFTVESGRFNLAVCADVQAAAIDLDTSDSLFGSESTLWWSASGGGQVLVAGSIVTTAELPGLFREVGIAEEPELDGVSTVSVVVEAATGPEDNIVAVFPKLDGAPWERGWVHPDGRVTEQPCD